MNYQKEYYKLLAKFGEYEFISPIEFEKLLKMAQGKEPINCPTGFTAGGGRNVCRLLEMYGDVKRKELAREILAAIKFYQPKVTAEKCLNDTVEKLEKEVKK